MSERAWFGAKCIFRHTNLSRRSGKQVYEERVVPVRASGFDDAIRKAEAEARRYAKLLRGTEYLEFFDVFEIDSAKPGHLSEVYSLMRSTDLDPDEYVTRYHDDGTQHSRKDRDKDAAT